MLVLVLVASATIRLMSVFVGVTLDGSLYLLVMHGNLVLVLIRTSFFR